MVTYVRDQTGRFQQCALHYKPEELDEVAQRKGEPVIDAGDRRNILREPLGQPVRDATSRPVLATTGRWGDLLSLVLADGAVDAQSLEAGLGRLGTGIVDADVAGKRGHRALRSTQDAPASRLS